MIGMRPLCPMVILPPVPLFPPTVSSLHTKVTSLHAISQVYICLQDCICLTDVIRPWRHVYNCIINRKRQQLQPKNPLDLDFELEESHIPDGFFCSFTTIIHQFLTWSEVTFVRSEVTSVMEQTDFWFERSDWGRNDHNSYDYYLIVSFVNIPTLELNAKFVISFMLQVISSIRAIWTRFNHITVSMSF